jgi:hypothetical protein
MYFGAYRRLMCPFIVVWADPMGLNFGMCVYLKGLQAINRVQDKMS